MRFFFVLPVFLCVCSLFVLSLLQEGRIPPADMLDPACITRNILADKPRVTRFPIDWNAAPGEAGAGAAGAEGAAAEGVEDDEMGVGEDNTVEEETGVSEANATGEPDVSEGRMKGGWGGGVGRGR